VGDGGANRLGIEEVRQGVLRGLLDHIAQPRVEQRELLRRQPVQQVKFALLDPGSRTTTDPPTTRAGLPRSCASSARALLPRPLGRRLLRVPLLRGVGPLARLTLCRLRIGTSLSCSLRGLLPQRSRDLPLRRNEVRTHVDPDELLRLLSAPAGREKLEYLPRRVLRMVPEQALGELLERAKHEGLDELARDQFA